MARTETIPELGPLEFKLLQILWKRSPATAREVLDDYNRSAPKKLKYTTVMTLLTRLAEKGALGVDRKRQPFQFQPVFSRDQMIRQRVSDFVDRFFDGSPIELALRLVEETPLSEAAVQELEDLLRRSKETSGSRHAEGLRDSGLEDDS
jgi:predicted transcriptional regulator